MGLKAPFILGFKVAMGIMLIVAACFCSLWDLFCYDIFTIACTSQ